jgi:hypothetical protein
MSCFASYSSHRQRAPSTNHRLHEADAEPRISDRRSKIASTQATLADARGHRAWLQPTRVAPSDAMVFCGLPPANLARRAGEPAT